MWLLNHSIVINVSSYHRNKSQLGIPRAIEDKISPSTPPPPFLSAFFPFFWGKFLSQCTVNCVHALSKSNCCASMLAETFLKTKHCSFFLYVVFLVFSSSFPFFFPYFSSYLPFFTAYSPSLLSFVLFPSIPLPSSSLVLLVRY